MKQSVKHSLLSFCSSNIMVAVWVLAGLLLAGLIASSCQSDGESDDTTGNPPDQMTSDSKTSDVLDEGRQVGDEGDTCNNWGRPGEGEIPEDECWDLPDNFCSQGATMALTNFCSPDYAVCCAYPNGCGPCGWHQCPRCNAPDGQGGYVPVHCASQEAREEMNEEMSWDSYPVGCRTASAPVYPEHDERCPNINLDEPICLDDWE